MFRCLKCKQRYFYNSGWYPSPCPFNNFNQKCIKLQKRGLVVRYILCKCNFLIGIKIISGLQTQVGCWKLTYFVKGKKYKKELKSHKASVKSITHEQINKINNKQANLIKAKQQFTYYSLYLRQFFQKYLFQGLKIINFRIDTHKRLSKILKDLKQSTDKYQQQRQKTQ